jgi:hypothetical protein
VGVTAEERIGIYERAIKQVLVQMIKCGGLKMPEEQKQYQAVQGDLKKVWHLKCSSVDSVFPMLWQCPNLQQMNMKAGTSGVMQCFVKPSSCSSTFGLITYQLYEISMVVSFLSMPMH